MLLCVVVWLSLGALILEAVGLKYFAMVTVWLGGALAI
jgi:hypothetical protein